MNFKIDNLQYCNWSRKIFEINRSAGLDAVHVTIVYHEDYDELLAELKKWELSLASMSSREYKMESSRLSNCTIGRLSFLGYSSSIKF